VNYEECKKDVKKVIKAIYFYKNKDIIKLKEVN
jgi:hypothetical protein